MGKRWAGSVVVGLLALALAGCGGGSSDSGPSVEGMVECLKRAGGTAESLEVESGYSMAAAVTADRDVIFIVPLPEPELLEPAQRAIQKRIDKLPGVGLMNTSTVDRGSTAIFVIGRSAVDGGVPSAVDEKLSRECAIRPRPPLSGESQA